MSVEFSVPLSQIAEALNLTEVYVAENYKETNISTVEINRPGLELSLIHISEPTRLRRISYAVFCLKKKKTGNN